MNTAVMPDGISVDASPMAPPEALCPYCRGKVVLRRRKLMNAGGFAYYWRHRDNENRDCPGRSRRT